MSDNERSEILRELASIGTKLDGIEASLARDHKILYGNGSPGLIRAVDRLEQRADRQTWLVRALLVAVIAVIVAAFVEHWRVYADMRASMNQQNQVNPVERLQTP